MKFQELIDRLHETQPIDLPLSARAVLFPIHKPGDESMIKPTIGRSLHFFAGDADIQVFGSRGPFACILAGVISDELINVGVFTNEGTVVGRTHVPLLQDSKITGESQSFCSWMPFQVGQARAQNTEPQLGTTERLESAFADHQARISKARQEYEQEKADVTLDPNKPSFGLGLTATPEFQSAQGEATAQLRSLVEDPPQTFEQIKFVDEGEDDDLEDDSDE